jgi:hypothetical protein
MYEFWRVEFVKGVPWLTKEVLHPMQSAPYGMKGGEVPAEAATPEL